MATAAVFKPGVCGRRLCAPGFLKLLWSACRYARVCVCLCVRPEAINKQWCDMDRVRLVKQVLRLFPAFNYVLHTALAIDKMDDRGHLTQHVVNTCQRKLRWRGTTVATKGLLERRSASFIKVTGRMRNDTFKRRLAFSFTVIILA